MARARKTKYTGAEWKQIFKQAVEYCKAHRGNMKFQECVRERLKAAEVK